jgi:mono/diheme cytochrome c family protein
MAWRACPAADWGDIPQGPCVALPDRMLQRSGMLYRWLMTLGLLLGWTLPAPADDDTAVFENRCAACHGNDGRAQTAQGRKMKAKDLRESRLSDAEIERQIREGSRVKTGVSVMPAVGKDMTEAEIQAAIRVVKAFRPPTQASK